MSTSSKKAKPIPWGEQEYTAQHIVITSNYIKLTEDDSHIGVELGEVDDLVMKLLVAKQMLIDGERTEEVEDGQQV